MLCLMATAAVETVAITGSASSGAKCCMLWILLTSQDVVWVVGGLILLAPVRMETALSAVAGVLCCIF
jgi:hypothetical protein